MSSASIIKTKIICTIGPKTQSVEMLTSLIEAGMNVMRLNFSHGTHDYHKITVENLRKAMLNHPDKEVAVLLDTKGPEIRTMKLEEGRDVQLKKGQNFNLYCNQVDNLVGNSFGVHVTYERLATTVSSGDVILVDDGLISLEVIGVEVNNGIVRTKVINSGLLGENKGVNLPGKNIDLPAITEKDRADIEWGFKMDVDFIAASFIRKPTDVLEIKAILKELSAAANDKKVQIQIISKIENQEGLDNFDEILKVTDAIMVARGDLGVEIPVERVARAQKHMIKKCNQAGKPCITATQMLESMICNPRPTRAEATDVANAVLDGSDAVMLSGETAKGAYPVETVETMVRICREAEEDLDYSLIYSQIRENDLLPLSTSEGIAAAAVKIAWDIQASVIFALSQSGNMARSFCKYRPIAPVLCISDSQRVSRQTQILRGIIPIHLPRLHLGDDGLVEMAMKHAIKCDIALPGDCAVVTSGVLEGISGSTNTLQVKIVQ